MYFTSDANFFSQLLQFHIAIATKLSQYKEQKDKNTLTGLQMSFYFLALVMKIGVITMLESEAMSKE